LSAAQQRVLQKLRWGLAKDLNYRGDGEDATVRMLSSAALATPTDPSAPTSEPPESRALRFVAENRDLFLLKNPQAELVVTAVEADSSGGQIVRMAQRFNGLEVWPGQLTANLSSGGYLTVITGTYAPTPESVLLEPQIQPDAAIAAAQQHLRLAPLLGKPASVLKIFADKGRTPELAFEVQLRAPGKLERVFVSATTGAVIFSYSEICNAGAVGSGADVFNQTRSLNVLPSGTPQRFYLMDTSKPMYSPATGAGVIAIYDASVSAPPVSSSATLTGGYDAAAVSAAFNLGKAYDFYYTAFNRNSFDGKGTTIRGLVKFPDPDTRGLWNNAHWDGQQICFGSAQNFAGASDVVGHEYSHAVIQTTADLIYDSESGALNESFADILGESFERYLTGTNDWSIGTLLNAPFRNMKDPQSKGQPAIMSQYVRTPNSKSGDYGGVHTNSGIPNRAFYLLAEGLAAGGIGFEGARNIFYRALTTKLNRRSDFHDLRAACVQSAIELFGAGSVQSTRTGQAFDAVEIYDFSAGEAPQNLTPPTGPDSYLIAYKAVDGNTYLGRREAALGDGASVTGVSSYAMNAGARASVSGDGSQAFFVSAAYDVVFANTNGNTGSTAGLPGNFNSVALSADGKYFACIARDTITRLPLNKIFYINTVTSASEVVDLYLPVADGTNSIKITSVDEVDLSPDGQIALFDGLAKTTFADGTSVQAWSIFAVDLRTKSVYSLAGPLKDFNIGNPAFARTSAQRLVFEAVDSTSNYIFAYDVGRGVLTTVRQFTPGNLYSAYPRFSAGDDFVVFTEQYFSLGSFSYQPRVSRISLTADRITASGASSVLQEQGYSGLSYRRGAFAGSPTLSVAVLTSTLTNGQSGIFRISRTSGDRAIRVPVTFKTLGTARPITDYSQVVLNATIPAGATFVDVSIRAAASLGAGTRTLTLSLDPQYHYLIAANGGDASMSIAGGALPTITTQPISQTVLAGSVLTLSVGTTDLASIFQWFKNGVLMAGATSRTLTLNSVTASDTGSYTCAVTNSVGSVASNAATITVGAVVAPSISLQPGSQSVTTGASVSFTVAATGTAPLTYQWRKDGTAISGATVASYAITSAQNTDVGSYTCVVANSGGSATSDAATLTVAIPTAAPVIAAQPTNATVTAGGSATLTVVVNGTSPLSYQWRKDSVTIPGATSATLKLNTVQIADRGFYTVVVSNTAGSVTSNIAFLNVVAAAVPNPGRLINLSVLTDIATPGDEFTLGYVVGGNSTIGAKPLVIRAAGPSLGALGVPATLADPRLELFAGSTKTGENDNWGGSSQLSAALSAVGAFAYTGPASKDAATTASITTRDNSVKVSAAGSGTGKVIAEVYDATPSASFTTTTPRLINVSVRKHLGAGLTMGFVLGGSTPTKVLVRAIGPTLGTFGVPGTVADPQLSLFNSSSAKIGENNDWGGTAELTAAFASVGAFPLPVSSKDAALLVALPPGNYSVQVSGVSNTTGVALVEVYEVP